MTLEQLRQTDGIIFECIVGSQAHGTNTENSDIDHKFVYMQTTNELISFGYIEQIDIDKDNTGYELRRFMQLLQTANPTVLELLYSPEDCIVKNTPQFELLIKHRDKFLTKKCLQSFGGYAVAQIKKAKGLDKMMNWEEKRVRRKTPIDFCYLLLEKEKSIKLKSYFKINENTFNEFKNWGLANINNFPDLYSMYYFPDGNGGICGIDSNEVQLRSIPKDFERKFILRFDREGYSTSCKDYRNYQDWLSKRNNQRFVDNAGHNQKIDSKNLMHCRRLLDIAMEIATEKTIKIRRPNADYLLSIRRGEVNLDEIITQAELDIKKLDNLFAQSDLPDDCDKQFVNDLLLEIRHLKI